MLARFLHEGDALDYFPVADVPLGAVVLLADAIGIASRAIPAGTLGSLDMVGVFELPRAVGPALPLGRRIYWDAGAQVVTHDSAAGANRTLGISATEVPIAATPGRIAVRLNHPA